MLVEIESDIEIINEFGETLIIPNEKTLISSQEPTGISVEASSRRELINGFYPVEYSGGEIVRMGTVSSPGSLDMTFDTKGVSQTFPKTLLQEQVKYLEHLVGSICLLKLNAIMGSIPYRLQR